MFLNGHTSNFRTIRRCCRRLARLRHRQPQKVTGKHLFLASKIREATLHNQSALGSGRQLSRQRVMALHGDEWQRLSNQARRMYEEHAALPGTEARESAEAAIEVEHRNLGNAQAVVDAGDLGNPSSMLVSQCRWSSQEVNQLQKLLHTDFLSGRARATPAIPNFVPNLYHQNVSKSCKPRVNLTDLNRGSQCHSRIDVPQSFHLRECMFLCRRGSWSGKLVPVYDCVHHSSQSGSATSH